MQNRKQSMLTKIQKQEIVEFVRANRKMSLSRLSLVQILNKYQDAFKVNFMDVYNALKEEWRRK